MTALEVTTASPSPRRDSFPTRQSRSSSGSGPSMLASRDAKVTKRLHDRGLVVSSKGSGSSAGDGPFSFPSSPISLLLSTMSSPPGQQGQALSRVAVSTAVPACATLVLKRRLTGRAGVGGLYAERGGVVDIAVSPGSAHRSVEVVTVELHLPERGPPVDAPVSTRPRSSTTPVRMAGSSAASVPWDDVGSTTTGSASTAHPPPHLSATATPTVPTGAADPWGAPTPIAVSAPLAPGASAPGGSVLSQGLDFVEPSPPSPPLSAMRSPSMPTSHTLASGDRATAPAPLFLSARAGSDGAAAGDTAVLSIVATPVVTVPSTAAATTTTTTAVHSGSADAVAPPPLPSSTQSVAVPRPRGSPHQSTDQAEPTPPSAFSPAAGPRHSVPPVAAGPSSLAPLSLDQPDAAADAARGSTSSTGVGDDSGGDRRRDKGAVLTSPPATPIVVVTPDNRSAFATTSAGVPVMVPYRGFGGNGARGAADVAGAAATTGDGVVSDPLLELLTSDGHTGSGSTSLSLESTPSRLLVPQTSSDLDCEWKSNEDGEDYLCVRRRHRVAVLSRGQPGRGVYLCLEESSEVAFLL